jgi:hypothetical protein
MFAELSLARKGNIVSDFCSHVEPSIPYSHSVFDLVCRCVCVCVTVCVCVCVFFFFGGGGGWACVQNL